jgi:hypothetical protein
MKSCASVLHVNNGWPLPALSVFLVQATRRGLIDIDGALTELEATDFRCTARVTEEVRRQAKLLS